jgi:hypothetical protein
MRVAMAKLFQASARAPRAPGEQRSIQSPT